MPALTVKEIADEWFDPQVDPVRHKDLMDLIERIIQQERARCAAKIRVLAFEIEREMSNGNDGSIR